MGELEPDILKCVSFEPVLASIGLLRSRGGRRDGGSGQGQDTWEMYGEIMSSLSDGGFLSWAFRHASVLFIFYLVFTVSISVYCFLFCLLFSISVYRLYRLFHIVYCIASNSTKRALCSGAKQRRTPDTALATVLSKRTETGKSSQGKGQPGTGTATTNESGWINQSRAKHISEEKHAARPAEGPRSSG